MCVCGVPLSYRSDFDSLAASQLISNYFYELMYVEAHRVCRCRAKSNATNLRVAMENGKENYAKCTL